MSDINGTLFWLQQEPVDSIADIYFPPDTPINTMNERLRFQAEKRAQIRKRRSVDRAQMYYYRKLVELRKSFAKMVDASKLNIETVHEEDVEVISGPEFLSSHSEKLAELMDLTTKAKHQEIPPSLEMITDQSYEARKKEQATYYKGFTEEQFNLKHKELLEEYETLVHKINSSGPQAVSSNSESLYKTNNATQPFHVSSVPPLPPRVSSSDPRTFLYQYNRRP